MINMKTQDTKSATHNDTQGDRAMKNVQLHGNFVPYE